MITLSRTHAPTTPATEAYAASPNTPPAAGIPVNDMHSELSATKVRRIVEVTSTADVQQAVRAAARDGLPVAISGGRHSMGGQQFVTDGVLLDTRSLNKPLAFDPDRGTVTVQAGIQWPELMKYLDDEPRNSVDDAAGTDHRWGIRQKQTGADRLSIGGAIASNIHGRGLLMKPFIDDVESFKLVDADGEVKQVSRTENADLFRHVVGGYGLFGVVTEATIRLAPRQQLERSVSVVGVDDLMTQMQSRIDAGAEFGDFQFSIDSKSPDFLQRGVLSTYAPVEDPEPIPADQKQLSGEQWTKLMHLAHTDKSTAFDLYAKHYLGTDGQRYWSDSHQMANYTDGYHHALDKAIGSPHKASEMISELYVPREQLADFMKAAAVGLKERDANVIYGTVRLIKQDDESALAWARKPWASVIFNLHTEHTPDGIAKSQEQFRHLIDLAAERGGSYYLTYHRWADKDQVQRAHPALEGVLAKKLQYDPQERFQSDWYRHYREMFGPTSDSTKGAALVA